MVTTTTSEIWDIMEELGICVDSFTDDIVHGKIGFDSMDDVEPAKEPEEESDNKSKQFVIRLVG